MFWLPHEKRVDQNDRLLASSRYWHIKKLCTPCGGQPESQFGADYLRKNHLSQKIAELRYIEIIFVARSLPKLVISWSNLKSKI